jgi:hypothetical protein
LPSPKVKKGKWEKERERALAREDAGRVSGIFR